ncbi:MAG: GNAT family N-acetyltransferase [Pseudomonadota bacterium]
MIPLSPPFREARAGDGPILAFCINEAGEGLPHALWRDMAGEGEDPWKLGAARMEARAEKGGIVVVDEGDGRGALAALIGYPIREAEGVGEDMPAAFRPLQELENLAVGSWYVNVLAALPDARGRGFGTRLLELAERTAAAEALEALSLIVAEDNAGARRLYERMGFEEAARRPMAGGFGWAPSGAEWILMVRRGPFG